MSIDISKLNEKELLKLRRKIDAAIDKLKSVKKDEARKAAEAAAKKHGFALSELIGNARARGRKSASAPKYANPADPGQTWSGRGRQPAWFKDAIAKGADPSSMEI